MVKFYGEKSKNEIERQSIQALPFRYSGIRFDYLPVRGWDAVPWASVPVEVLPVPVVP